MLRLFIFGPIRRERGNKDPFGFKVKAASAFWGEADMAGTCQVRL